MGVLLFLFVFFVFLKWVPVDFLLPSWNSGHLPGLFRCQSHLISLTGTWWSLLICRFSHYFGDVFFYYCFYCIYSLSSDIQISHMLVLHSLVHYIYYWFSHIFISLFFFSALIDDFTCHILKPDPYCFWFIFLHSSIFYWWLAIFGTQK